MLDVMYAVEVLDDSALGLRAQLCTATSTTTPPALPTTTSTTGGAAADGFPGGALHDALLRRRTLSEPALTGVKAPCSPETAGAAKGESSVLGAAAGPAEAGRPAEALQPGEHGCRCCSGGGNGVDPLTALAPSLECTLEADRGGCSEQCLEPPPHSDQLQSGTPQHCPGSDVAAAAAAAAAAADATATISLSSLHLHKAAQGKTVEATKNLDQRQQQHGQDREEGELAGKDMERSRGRDSGRGERVVVSSGGKGRATAGAHEGRYSCWGSVGRARAPKQQQQQKGAGVGVGVAEGRGMGQQGGVSLAEQQELQATMLLHYL